LDNHIINNNNIMANNTASTPSNREVVQSDALSIAVKHKRCGLGISMGVGKTRIAIKHLMINFNPLIEALVVIPKHSVAQSWIDELGKMDLEKLTKHITFTTYLSLKKHNPNDYDIVYLDECHSLKYSHELFLGPYVGKILGLTGTPPKNKTSEKGMLVQKYCPIKYEFSVDEATDSNILNDYQIVIHELELSKVPALKKKNKAGGHWWTTEEKDYNYVTSRLAEAQSQQQIQFARIMRMRALMDYTSKESYVKSILKNIDTQCIVFANTQKQADRICKHSYHSGNPKSEENLELFSDGRINHLSCVLQLSEGVTIPNLKQGIIMHAYGNEKKTAQRIGRLLRLNPSETAVCHILCYKGTQDVKWVEAAISSFDPNKIKRYNPLKR
jgi:superfamily II DNA or RNA helicase